MRRSSTAAPTTPRRAVATLRSPQTSTPQSAALTPERRELARGPARREAGLRAERAVADYLKARGFAIVATNLRVSYLEIDVVARRGDLIVVVEVRSRTARAWTTSFGSMDGRKRYRIRLAGQRLWERRYRHDASVNRLRFDAASVVFDEWGEPQIEYAEAAF